VRLGQHVVGPINRPEHPAMLSREHLRHKLPSPRGQATRPVSQSQGHHARRQRAGKAKGKRGTSAWILKLQGRGEPLSPSDRPVHRALFTVPVAEVGVDRVVPASWNPAQWFVQTRHLLCPPLSSRSGGARGCLMAEGAWGQWLRQRCRRSAGKCGPRSAALFRECALGVRR